MSIKRSITFSEPLYDKLSLYAKMYFQGNVSACLGFIVSKFFINEIDNAITISEPKPKKMNLSILDDD